MDNERLFSVQAHYGESDLVASLQIALEQAGLGVGKLDEASLAPLDQFHVRGLAATQELAGMLPLAAGATVLDVGCGLGGPARYLAATHGCRVTGIDLSQPFVDAARMLSDRTGLTERTAFLQADALALPFADTHFDVAWTQHVAMNIADRAGLYASIYRVLKPGGLLAIYDVVLGDGEPLLYPVPWAQTPEISFLLSADAMRQALANAGFTPVWWADTTDAARNWFAVQQGGGQNAPASPLNLSIVMGPQFQHMAANLGRNLGEGRARLIQAVVRRDEKGNADAA